jgi:hypothetical protein
VMDVGCWMLDSWDSGGGSGHSHHGFTERGLVIPYWRFVYCFGIEMEGVEVGAGGGGV